MSPTYYLNLSLIFTLKTNNFIYRVLMDPSLPVLSEEDRLGTYPAQIWKSSLSQLLNDFCMPFSMWISSPAQTNSKNVNVFIHHAQYYKTTVFQLCKSWKFDSKFSLSSLLFCLFEKMTLKNLLSLVISIKHFNVSSSLLCASSSCHTNYICPWEFYFIPIKTNFKTYFSVLFSAN